MLDQPSILFNQQWFLNRHRRFQFRTDGTSFSASEWAGVGQQVQEEFVHCTGPGQSQTMHVFLQMRYDYDEAVRILSGLDSKKLHGNINYYKL